MKQLKRNYNNFNNNYKIKMLIYNKIKKKLVHNKKQLNLCKMKTCRPETNCKHKFKVRIL